ncbi:hypothetical protein PR202_ga13331 [Eleusine coracana subsp. coracana]|uniref:Uncharacterized protein n=1 Tax=Eleusine coracana subsp. coracana TaxID=191504 RepID=A0AAV5CDS7_ELECO|nr:hypothetical protein PR202_ga13331 [Eleusine coracana subsp. coracana]
MTPLIAQYISEGIEQRQQPHINLKACYSLALKNISRDISSHYLFLYLKSEISLGHILYKIYGYYLAYFWMNDNATRDAIGVKEETVGEWKRCILDDFPYTKDLPSSIIYHSNLTTRGYRALVYSGDHDLMVPFLGTQAWIRSLNFPIEDEWRAWHLDGQAAGFTITYANNLTFATVKGAGHTAPEYRPKESFAMAQRWLDNKPL